MKVLVINGSPRKTGNTATFLNKALEGAASQGAETELIHLRDLNFRGCRSCLTCKLKDEKYRGKCAMKDELSSILEKVKNVDALILGSPIYMGIATSDMRAFFERLFYPYLSYDADNQFIFPKKIPTGFIYTMGASEQRMKEAKIIDQYITFNEILMTMFGSSESLIINDTNLNYDNPKNSKSTLEHEEMKSMYQEAFPDYCGKAYEMGASFAKSGNE
jgi:multimeric flavodoxin WrbA